MSNQQLINKFRKLHQQYLSLVDEFPAGDREKILFDKWSLKDVLTHLCAWNDLDTSRIEALQKGGTFEWVDDWDTFNKIELNKKKGLSWEKIYKDFADSGSKLVNAYQLLDDDLWNKEFGPNNNITAVKDLSGMIGHYEKEHIPQLKGKLSLLN